MKNEEKRFSIKTKMYIFVVITVLAVAAGTSILAFMTSADQIDKFYKQVTSDNARNYRPEMKFVCDMTYGMLASGSSMLSEIARYLNEKIPLIKTVNRLSRNLQDMSDDERKIVMENYLKAIKPRYNDQSVIVIDGSDITKPASTKLEALCWVRDGSTGEIGIGYHTIGAAVLSSENKLPFGVYSRIYSSTEMQLST